jgi:threonine aldolase
VIEALLAEGFEFYRWTAPAGASGPVIRLVTSFCTAAADVDAFVAAAGRYAIDQDAPG